MSNFTQNAIHPKTGNIELAEMLDDCFGHHGYGVLFKDGSLYAGGDVETVEGNAVPSADVPFKTKEAYAEAKRIMEYRKKQQSK